MEPQPNLQSFNGVQMLKFQTEIVNTIEVNDLEKFITETTGHTYEVVPNEEWNNDSQHRLHVDGDLSEYTQKDWDDFKLTGEQHQYRLQTIMEGLCADGHLEAGVYVVDVSW